MILVTGSEGFIGKRITERLDQLNLRHIRYDITFGNDIRDEFQLSTIFESSSVDTIIHLAAITRADESQLREFISVNILGTEVLLNLAKKYDVRRIIAFSSSAVYGNQPGPQSETTPVEPISLYGVTKVAMEMLCQKSGIPTIIVRPFSVYGENNSNDHIINIWMNRLKNNEPVPFYVGRITDIKRGYTYVEDLIDGVIRILSQTESFVGFEVFNLAGKGFVTLEELLRIFKFVYPELMVRYFPIPSSCPYENWADIDNAEHLLGWKPKTNFEEKVREIIKK